jgi:hypothetical protein
MIGPISLGAKRMGARSAGKPHAACDVEGAGNVVWTGVSVPQARQSSTLPRGFDTLPAKAQPASRKRALHGQRQRAS